MKRLMESIRRSPASMMFQAALTAAFLIPLIATAGQFASSGFLFGGTPVLILFWPGAEWKWAPSMPVWLAWGAMGVSYVAGMSYLLHRKTFGRVVLWSVAGIVLANLLGSAVNHLTGWRELQSMNSLKLSGKMNGAVFAMWQNPLWEEVVFRGLPLLALLLFAKRSAPAHRWVQWGYLILPNIVFAAYHVPGHGPSRMVDTFVLGCAFSWLALRYTFFAPLIMHYVLDAMMVINLQSIPNVPTEEIVWLVQNNTWLNSSWSLALLAAMLALPAWVIWDLTHTRQLGAEMPVSAPPELQSDKIVEPR